MMWLPQKPNDDWLLQAQKPTRNRHKHMYDKHPIAMRCATVFFFVGRQYIPIYVYYYIAYIHIHTRKSYASERDRCIATNIRSHICVQ